MTKKISFIIILIFIGVIFEQDITTHIRAKNLTNKEFQVEVEPGDLIVRPNLNLIFGSSKVEGGRLFGHASLCIKGGTLSDKNDSLNDIIIMESRLFRWHPLEWNNGIIKTSASTSFGEEHRGRRYILKTHLNPEQLKKILYYADKFSDRPYSIFPSKDGGTANCSSFIKIIFSEALGINLDSNGGNYVYPNDIINHPMFDGEKNKIIF
ncbi:MAG: hypothetical protein WCR82_07585 [Bacteroidales bacterium]|jgi:hypothetical protein